MSNALKNTFIFPKNKNLVRKLNSSYFFFRKIIYKISNIGDSIRNLDEEKKLTAILFYLDFNYLRVLVLFFLIKSLINLKKKVIFIIILLFFEN